MLGFNRGKYIALLNSYLKRKSIAAKYLAQKKQQTAGSTFHGHEVE